MKKQAFTLAEIMIVLTVIGVLTAILLPVAIQSSPDENIMKFKKGNATLGKVISELVNSDKYYADGDLGRKANGNTVDESSDENKKYFCQSFADVISTKSVNCSTAKTNYSHVGYSVKGEEEGAHNALATIQELDAFCKEAAATVGSEIVTPDDITYYQGCPGVPFGVSYIYYNSGESYPSGQVTCAIPIGTFYLTYEASHSTTCDGYAEKQKMGIKHIHKVFCMDVDGIGKGEDPFGYGIRVDGKILYGARAQEWMNKSMQKGDK